MTGKRAKRRRKNRRWGLTLSQRRRHLERAYRVPDGAMREVSQKFIDEAFYKFFIRKNHEIIAKFSGKSRERRAKGEQ